jgi:hypothetical protein
VGSEATAKVRIADLKRLKVLITYLIRDANLYSVKYKASGSNAKKPSEAWVFDGDTKEIYVDGMYIGTEDSLYIKSNKP